MKIQNYKNHIRYYTPHHFIFYPLITAMLFIAIKCFLKQGDDKWQWAAIAALTFLIGWLSFMLRQHYALTNQNRIVRLEMRLRYFQLTQKRLEPLEEKLGFGKIAALRFASDAEMPALLQKALDENLTADDIKRSIKNWIPDLMRV